MALAALKMIYEAENLPVPTAVASPLGGDSDQFRTFLREIEARIDRDIENLVRQANSLRDSMPQKFEGLRTAGADLETARVDIRGWLKEMEATESIRRASRDATSAEAEFPPQEIASRSREDVWIFQSTARRIVRRIDSVLDASAELRATLNNLLGETPVHASQRVVPRGRVYTFDKHYLPPQSDKVYSKKVRNLFWLSCASFIVGTVLGLISITSGIKEVATFGAFLLAFSGVLALSWIRSAGREQLGS
jgi:hypothetical protein